MESTSVLIVGGGPASIALAIGLLSCNKKNFIVSIIENRWADDQFVRYGTRSYPVNVTARGMRALEEIGVLYAELLATECVDSFYGHAHCHWSHDTYEEFPHSECIIGTRDDIVCALLKIAHARGLKFTRIQAQVYDLNVQNKTINQGAFGPYDLIIGADGKNSIVRKMLQIAGKITVRTRESRIGETLFKSFHLHGVSSFLRRGWLYLHPPTHAVFSLIPNEDIAIGIMPHGSSLSYLPSRFVTGISPQQHQTYEEAPMVDAGGGFVVSDLAIPGGFALIGDAAVSPAPAGQGINHAFDAAASLCRAIQLAPAQYCSLENSLLEWNEQRKPDEAAYALFGDAQKPFWLKAACLFGSPLGLHTWSGHYLKSSAAPYAKLTSVPALLAKIGTLSPLPSSPAADTDTRNK